jgi:hypothetical protein
VEVISSSSLTLSSEERVILIELLDRERTNLPVEIHHTRTGKFRDLLKHRLEMVDAILERLSPS